MQVQQLLIAYCDQRGQSNCKNYTSCLLGVLIWYTRGTITHCMQSLLMNSCGKSKTAGLIAIITMPKGFASLLWQYRTAAKLKSIKVIITSGVPISKKTIRPTMFSTHESLLGPRIRTQRRRDRGLLMRYGDSLSLLSLASSHLGGLPYSVQHMPGGGHIRVNRLKLSAPIYAYTEHAQFVDVSQCELWQRTVAQCRILFMRDEGCSLSFSLHPQQQFTYLRNYDVIYEIPYFF